MKKIKTLPLGLLVLSINTVWGLGRNTSSGGGGSTPAPSEGISKPTTPIDESGSSSSSPSIPSNSSAAEIIAQIQSVAANSSCAAYSWKSRGKAPKGYIKGMALTYARSLCRTDDPRTDRRTPASLMAAAQSGNTSKDALAYLKSKFDSAGLSVSRSGAQTLRSLYTLGIGHGMRESSGKYCQGWDVSAGSYRSSSEAEAGLFQSSYNSSAASSELKKLYAEYKANKNRCMLNVFKEGVSCTSRSILGSGEGATFQKLSKECPAFATEYAMVVLRVLRKHYGPINRKESEIIKSCDTMLSQVESLVNSKRSEFCSSLD